MCTITKAAMRGVKFYKHIVQIVEKFIARCRPEYKVPGLYVIDSIVRQSRHQFGPDRDVYGPRFARNLNLTFDNLFSDSHEEDRARMVRVLNLWSINGVFDSQTIRPLLEMADSANASRSTSSGGVVFQRDPKSPSSGETNSSTSKQHYSSFASSVSTHQKYPNAKPGDNPLKFSKNMLDFDYDEDDDDDGHDDADETPTEAEPPLSSTLSKLEMEQRVRRPQNDSGGLARKSSITSAGTQPGHKSQQNTSATSSKQQSSQQDPVLERWNKIIKGELTNDEPLYSSNTTSSRQSHQTHRLRRSRSRSPPTNEKLSQHKSHHDNHQHQHNHQQHHRTSTTTTLTTKEANLLQTKVDSNPERAAERERKCLPKIRDKHLTVCSSTLWLGHVPKMVSEADISDAFGEFGTINSIDLIPPRGCAFVCMDRRQDAKRALQHSKRIKLNGSHIRIAWAPGKGLKEQKKWKDFWDSDVGASYVPYSKVDLDSMDFDLLEEGGVIDEDSMSMEMLKKRDSKGGHGEKVKVELAKIDHKELSGNNQVPPSQPELPIFSQGSGLQQFVVPPPPLNLGIPPPSMLLAQGLLPFPPPSHHNMSLGAGSPMLKSNQDSNEQRDNNKQPSERKINIVEQQLSLLQQGQNINRQQTGVGNDVPDTSGLFYQLNQSDSMLFPHAQMLQMAALVNPTGNMIDPAQQTIFDGFNPGQMLLRPPLMLPINNQQGVADLSSMDDSFMAHQHGNY